MSQLIRRHGLAVLTPVVLLGVGLLLVLVELGPGPAHRTALGQALQAAEPDAKTPVAEATDPLLYTQVQTIRQELALGNEDLGAMGLSREQAGRVIASLKTWVERNQAALLQADREVRQSAGAVQEAMRRVHMGPRDESLIRQLPELGKAVTAARGRRQALIQAAVVPVTAALNASQRAVRQTVLDNRGKNVAGVYRYVPGLDAKAVAELDQQARQRARAKGEGDRRNTADALAPLQRRAAEAALVNQASFMEGVLQAQDQTLPIPQEWKQEQPTGTPGVPGVPGTLGTPASGSLPESAGE